MEPPSDIVEVPHTLTRAHTFAERHKTACEMIDGLAKPQGSLGSLEEWCARLCALQCTSSPTVTAASLIFVADHGVAAPVDEGGEGCSAFPQQITAAVAETVGEGKAGVSTLGDSVGVVCSRIYDVGVNAELTNRVRKAVYKVTGGTKNFL